jgi:hypothetical protein
LLHQPIAPEAAAPAPAHTNVADQPTAGWTAHDGVGCPVNDLARVQVRFRADRDRAAAEDASGPEGVAAHVYSDSWTFHAGSQSAADIVEFRVVA